MGVAVIATVNSELGSMPIVAVKQAFWVLTLCASSIPKNSHLCA